MVDLARWKGAGSARGELFRMLRARLGALACMVLLGLALPGCGAEGRGDSDRSQDRVVDLSRWIDAVDGSLVTFVALDGTTGQVVRHNAARAMEPFVPASTFKIPHALIALELGVLTGPDHTLERGGEGLSQGAVGPSETQTLAMAISHSTVWYFQEVARRIGPERMAAWLSGLDYGNRQAGPDPERFWLDGDLRISADQQVDFLRRLWTGELPVAGEAVELVKGMLVLDDLPGRKVWGKTGTTAAGPEGPIIWLVGTWEKAPGDLIYFALNLHGEEARARWGAAEARLGLVQRLLRALERE